MMFGARCAFLGRGGSCNLRRRVTEGLLDDYNILYEHKAKTTVPFFLTVNGKNPGNGVCARRNVSTAIFSPKIPL